MCCRLLYKLNEKNKVSPDAFCIIWATPVFKGLIEFYCAGNNAAPVTTPLSVYMTTDEVPIV